MYSSRWGFLSPLHSPSGSPATPLPTTPLRGLGLSHCRSLPETNETLLELSSTMGSYSMPLRLESLANSRAIFPVRKLTSPSPASNLQPVAKMDDCLGFGVGRDVLQSQNRTKSRRAFSWPGDCPNLEQSQEIEDSVCTKNNDSSASASKHVSNPRKKTTRIGRDRNQGITKASLRVTCSYGNGCRQTFNRKTDLDRHINTVRRTQHRF